MNLTLDLVYEEFAKGKEKLRVVQDIFVSSCLLKRKNDGFGEKRKRGGIY